MPLIRTGAALMLMAALVTSPAAAQSDSAQNLSSCAGAVAAVGNLDVLTYPRGASGDWAATLGAILERLNRAEGLEGMTGRYAASAAKDFWRGQPAAEREAAANACRERFGS
jgi:hypothetical protein